MKKLILLALTCTVIVMSNCTPSPSPGPATPTPTSTSGTMTVNQAALIGDWIWDSSIYYNVGNRTKKWTNLNEIIYSPLSIISNTLQSGSHMVFKSSKDLSGYYDLDFYTNTGIIPGSYYMLPSDNQFQMWRKPFGTLGPPMPFEWGTNGLWYYISILNSNKLVYQDWLPGQVAQGAIAYYHK